MKNGDKVGALLWSVCTNSSSDGELDIRAAQTFFWVFHNHGFERRPHKDCQMQRFQKTICTISRVGLNQILIDSWVWSRSASFRTEMVKSQPK